MGGGRGLEGENKYMTMCGGVTFSLRKFMTKVDLHCATELLIM